MQKDPLNPYFNLGAIRNADMFFGRTHLLSRFYAAVAYRQSVSLLGPRHIGKSSLLRVASLPEIQARFELDLSHHIFVFLDLREYLRKTSEDFFHSVTQEIALQSHKLQGLHLQATGNGEDEFSSILDQLEEHNFFPVLLMDAFDNITRNKHFGPEFFAFLRAHATIGKISYVTASIAPLYEVCHHDIADSPFFNIFCAYTLEALTCQEARELIAIPAQKAGLPFTEEEIAWILRLAGRHPFFIQRTCHFLFEEKLIQGEREIDEQHVKSLIYKDLLPHFQDTWKRLSATDQALLRDEAQQKDNRQRKLPELSGSAFFRQFVRNISKIELFKMSPDELEKALDKIDDPRALGETNLRLMKVVSLHPGRTTATSEVERGQLIRDILHKAFEHLRGSGERADAPEWLLYNILYYRYFKYRMKNEQISARLGFNSIRQYYRYRNKAIEALLNILFDMERAVSTE